MSRTVVIAEAGMGPATKLGAGARYDMIGGEADRLASAVPVARSGR